MTTDNDFINMQNEYEAVLAKNIEDDTLRVFMDIYYDNQDGLNFTGSVGIFETSARTLYLMILGSSTAFDHLVHTSPSADGENLCEVAREWLRDYGAGDDSGAIFEAELISRIESEDFIFNEGTPHDVECGCSNPDCAV